MPSHIEENSSIIEQDPTKPCRSCVDFRSWMKMQSKQSKDIGKKQIPTAINNDTPSDSGSNGSNSSSSSATNSATTNVGKDSNDEPELWGKAASEGCPADINSLGRGTWRLLHTMAANYPIKPSHETQTNMKDFIGLFSKLYPCPPCAEDFREWLRDNPPDVSSGSALSQFFCRAHNEVNRKQGKEEFDCRLVDQRWKTGWSDGSCG